MDATSGCVGSPERLAAMRAVEVSSSFASDASTALTCERDGLEREEAFPPQQPRKEMNLFETLSVLDFCEDVEDESGWVCGEAGASEG